MYPPTDHKISGIRTRWSPLVAVCLMTVVAAGIFPGRSHTSSRTSPDTADSLERILPAGPRPVRNWPVILDNSIRYTPAAADIDGDGRDEVAVGVQDCRVYLLDGDGKVLPGWPCETAAWISRGLMLDDIDGDGEYEIGAVSDDGLLHMWHEDGGIASGWPVDLGGKASSAPVVVRSAGSREISILVSAQLHTVHLLSPRGMEREGWPKILPQKAPAGSMDKRPSWAADLDGDGIPEILHLTSEPPVLHAWYLSGEIYPGYPAPVRGDEGMGLAIDDTADPRCIAIITKEIVTLRRLDTGREIYIHPDDTSSFFAAPPWFISSGKSADGGADLLMSCTNNGCVCVWDLEGRMLPGWPICLDGFIYGLQEIEEKHVVYGPPIMADVDGDNVPEIILGCYDHHLYCFELDGSSVPGWPVVLDDFIIHALALAQLDGEGEKELVVGQFGETLFAFHLDPFGPAMDTLGNQEYRTYSEWPGVYYAVSLAIIIMLLFLAHLLRRELAGNEVSSGILFRRALIFFLLVLVIRALFFASDLYRYTNAMGLLAKAEPQIHAVLRDERGTAQKTVDGLAAGLRECKDHKLVDPVRALRCLEQLTDRTRLEYRFTGVLLAGGSGRIIQGVGLGRGWTDLEQLGISGPVPSEPLLIGDIPVFAVESSAGIAAGQDTLRVFLLSSLLNKVPHALADKTGFSAYIRVAGRTMAWGGAGLRPYRSLRPWLGVVQPSKEMRLAGPRGEPSVSILLAKEDFERPLSQWLDLTAVLILPCVFLVVVIRRGLRERVALRWWWVAGFGIAYILGAVLIHQGRLETGPVPASGRAIEVLLHMVGITGVVVVLHRVVTSHRSRRLNFLLMGSYLVVSLIPLSVLMIVAANLFLGIRADIIGKTVRGLEDKADNLVLAYMGNTAFGSRLMREGPEILNLPPETRWLNFVEENQYLFNYDFPTAFLTLWARDRGDSTKYFTGYSYRAPRTFKLYYERPKWTGEDNIVGLFLDNGTAVIRAMRKYRYGSLDIDIVSHIPVDGGILSEIEDRLRVLPFLPRVHLDPAWIESTAERSRPDGWYIPYSSELVLQARGWYSGRPRWVVYKASTYIPAGAETFRVLLPVILLILLPLGLSFWGAYTTYRRTAHPLTRLLTGIRRVGAGDLEYRLGESGESEVGMAARSFDAMASSLQEMIGELARKQKVEEVSELKSRFISMVSHDLKTPLASIKGATENILEEVAGPVTDRQRTYLDMILKSSGDLMRMITDLLDLSRIESGRLRLDIEPLDIRRETEDLLGSIGPLLEKEEMTGILTVHAETSIVRGDRTRVWQILNNIVSNAVRYSPRGGRIEISIEDVPADETDGRRMVLVSVRDEGPGISEESAAKLFEPFFYRPSQSTSAHGAGLGLAIVKQLVELHGGSVAIKNAPAGGTVFSFTLPA